MGGDGGVGERAAQLAERSIAYAQGAVEGMRLAGWDVIDALQAFSRASAELAERASGMAPAELLDHMRKLSADLAGRLAPVVDVEVTDMELVTHAIARGFVMGWEARGDELGRRERALGGVGEVRRKLARKAADCDAAAAPARRPAPRRRPTGGKS